MLLQLRIYLMEILDKIWVFKLENVENLNVQSFPTSDSTSVHFLRSIKRYVYETPGEAGCSTN